MPFTILPQDPAVEVDGEIHLRLQVTRQQQPKSIRWAVLDDEGTSIGTWGGDLDPPEARWHAIGVQPGAYRVRAHFTTGDKGDTTEHTAEERIVVHARAVRVVGPVRLDGPVRVDLQRANLPDTPDLALWEVIKLGTEAISFDRYAAWMDYLFCRGELPASFYPDGDPTRDGPGARWQAIKPRFADPDQAGAPLPFPDIEGYKVLKAATEAFLELNCGVVFDKPIFPTMRSLSASDREALGLESGDTLSSLWQKYLLSVDHKGSIPYLYRVRQKLRDIELTPDRLEGELCNKILEAKFTSPCLLELIWSYWHEEGMLVQTMNAISMRFQNRRRLVGPDPLTNLAIDPLRPLSNLLWGYIQDEQHRLTLAHRAYEYDKLYGLMLLGKGVPQVRGAESRSGFLQAFHNLLHRTSIFYKEDDDTTVIADAFPVLNALREVHLLLAEGDTNQHRGLTWTARGEMLMQQWLLARPEFREFLPTRVMVVYPEPWMDRVDAMKKVQGWTDTSVRFFRDLGVFGEQILLSIRFGDWSNVTDRQQAANWARAWRNAVSSYTYAYCSATGVDLSADMTDVRQAEQARARALPPAFHLQRRLAEQRRGSGIAMGQPVAPLPGRPV